MIRNSPNIVPARSKSSFTSRVVCRAILRKLGRKSLRVRRSPFGHNVVPICLGPVVGVKLDARRSPTGLRYLNPSTTAVCKNLKVAYRPLTTASEMSSTTTTPAAAGLAATHPPAGGIHSSRKPSVQYTILTPIRLSKGRWATGVDFEPAAPETCRNGSDCDNRDVRPILELLVRDLLNSCEASCRSHENEEGVNEDRKNDYPRPLDAAHAAAAHRRIEPAHEYQEEERKRHQTSHANTAEHPSPQTEEIRKKDRTDARINQPAGKGVGA